ncbi:MAG: PEGA domain-containing protein, partial [Acidobacteriota bacterium]
HRDSDFLTFKAITEEVIPDIRDRRPDLPPGMRAALVQAMARDPSGRFDTAQAFGNAIKNSVATLGGPASLQELARLLFTDFSDEMASRDEILKAADDPSAAPISVGVKPAIAPPPPPPPKPPPLPTTSGEMHQSTPARPRPPTGPLGDSVPSMIVQSGSTRVALPDLANVLDLSNNMGADSWMAEGGTDLLSAHRWKSLAKLVVALIVVGAAAAGIIFFVMKSGGNEPAPVAHAPVADAAVKRVIVEVPIDAAEVNKDDIVALSHYGFFSITATAKTTIYIDDKNIGETPLTRLPVKPGPHTVKAVGPKGKSKIIKIAIVAGRDDDEGTITW